MSHTTTQPHKAPVPTITFDEAAYQQSFRVIQGDFVTIGLLDGLYGVLAVLSVLAVHALTQRSGKIQVTAVVLCLTILAPFTSTTTYVVVSFLYYQSGVLRSFILSGVELWSEGTLPINFPVSRPLRLVKDYSELQPCASTRTLTLNLILGDAIVCWRACVVWHKNRIVRAICGVFLLATLALGVFDTCQTFSGHGITLIDEIKVGTMFEGISFGTAACVLSLSTNLLATLLIGYKAWESRRRLKGYLVTGSRASRVQKLFALLIESGAAYCAIWAVIVAFQVGEYKRFEGGRVQAAGEIQGNNFLDLFTIFVNGGLVPVIGIYPAVIIVLVAYNRSHVEKALSHNDIPTPHLSVVVGTITTSRHNGRLEMSEVLVIDGRGSSSASALEEATALTREEQKNVEHVQG